MKHFDVVVANPPFSLEKWGHEKADGDKFGRFRRGISAAILVLRRDKTDKNIFFIDASREYQSGKNQNQLSDENIRKIIEAYETRTSGDKCAHLTNFDEIKENEFNLNIPCYIDTFEEEAEIDLEAVRAKRAGLKAELAELEAKMDGYLKELGYGGYPIKTIRYSCAQTN